jgi:glycerol-3-phosphate dehydrogenase
LLTVSGGKLTTFRIMARDALKAARKYLGHVGFDVNTPVLTPILSEAESALAQTRLPPAQQVRLLARYGIRNTQIFLNDPCRETISNTPYLWAEVRHAAREESVIHLDDLLLRRVRLGLLASNGGMDLLPRIRAIVQLELGWDDARWDKEVSSYLELWKCAYSLC